jgi:hypothetical protein
MVARKTRAARPALAKRLIIGAVTMAVAGTATPLWALDATQAPRAQVGFALPLARGLVDGTGAERSADWLRANGLYAANASKLWDGWRGQFVDNTGLAVQAAGQSNTLLQNGSYVGASSLNVANAVNALNATNAGTATTAWTANQATTLASNGFIDGSKITGFIDGSKISGTVANAANAGTASQAYTVWDARLNTWQWVNNVTVSRSDSTGTADRANTMYNNYTGAYDWASNLKVGSSGYSDNSGYSNNSGYANVSGSTNSSGPSPYDIIAVGQAYCGDSTFGVALLRRNGETLQKC